jgi:hypothetical protein
MRRTHVSSSSYDTCILPLIIRPEDALLQKAIHASLLDFAVVLYQVSSSSYDTCILLLIIHASLLDFAVVLYQVAMYMYVNVCVQV